MKKYSADILIQNIGELITAKNPSGRPKVKEGLNDLGIIKNGALVIKDGVIVDAGENRKVLSRGWFSDVKINAENKAVMPGFVDCHTHLIFGGSREQEFVEKVKGASYLEILKSGGGILDTVAKTREELVHPQILMDKILKTVKLMLDWGTTTAEAKSGYGLNREAEIQILKLIKQLNKVQPLNLAPTFLGAHAIPKEYRNKRRGYLDLIVKMLPEIKKLNLAQYCDVFCEKEAFSAKESEKILNTAKSSGFKIKLHTNEFNDIGGIELGIKLKASSLDHLDILSYEKIRKLAKSGIIAVLLPGVPFHLMSNKYAPARLMIKEGVPIALASDFNPGTCPIFSMQIIIGLACREMKMTPAEAINAATINAAHAIDSAGEIGSLEIGKKADIIILKIPNHQQLPYWFGMNLVEIVIKNGRIVKEPGTIS